MFSNFTTETCTGTGDTLTLTGATTGQIAFSESFADGDLVSYALEDSGGSIKAAGIGTFNSVGTITRNDTWNYNGTVVDKNPATNIVLSAGSHTVRCDVVKDVVNSGYTATHPSLDTSYFKNFHNATASATTSQIPAQYSAGANRLACYPFTLGGSTLVSEIGISVTTPSAGGNTRIGIYSRDTNGLPANLISDFGDYALDVAGDNVKTVSVYLPVGSYFYALLTDNTVAAYRGTIGLGSVFTEKLAANASNNFDGVAYSYSQAYGALPSSITNAHLPIQVNRGNSKLPEVIFR